VKWSPVKARGSKTLDGVCKSFHVINNRDISGDGERTGKVWEKRG